jgi:hypothetical protein
MGINPAVFMANYYLFFLEYQLLTQFRGMFRASSTLPGLIPMAQQW